MSDPNSKPDLEDSINVTEAHGKVVREAAACAREKRIVENGIEPVSFGLSSPVEWSCSSLAEFSAVAASCSLTARLPRGIRPDTRRWRGRYRPGAEGSARRLHGEGLEIYSAKCNGCHGSDAKGNGSTFPSCRLHLGHGETERLAMIILNGLEGPVSNGTTYGVMPPQGIGMTPEDLAGIMTYVRNNFGNAVGDVVTTDMAKAAIEISAARKNAGKSATAAELTADHVKALPGDVLDPKTLLDPITLAPAKAP